MVETTSKEERINFLTSEYDLTTNAAKTLILTEMGYTSSKIARLLDVNESTAEKYFTELESEIGQHVTETVPKSQRYNTFPSDERSVEVIGQDLDQIFPVNKGVALEDISTKNISIEV